MPNKIQLMRYEEIIKQVVNNAISQEVNNKYAKWATVVSVKLTNDLSYANIFIDCLNRNDINKVLENLNVVKGFLRTKVSQALNIYKTPQLVFKIDNTIDYSQQIEKLIAEIHEKDKHEGK